MVLLVVRGDRIINTDCHGVADISNTNMQNVIVHGSVDVYDSCIDAANVASKLYMARCHGKSCLAVGGLDMQQSEYEE